MIAYSTKAIVIAKAVLLGLSLTVFLVSPIYPMYSLIQGEMAAGTLATVMLIQVGFTCIFASCLRYLIQLRRYELFACTVASVFYYSRFNYQGI